jgi:predicted nucleic acid-binding protein
LHFLESSSLIKLFVAEQGSQEMVLLVERMSDQEKTISALTPVEIRSAIRRRERAGEITTGHATSAIASLTAESRRLIEHPLSSAVVTRALAIIDVHALRALDAFQLATALLVREALAPSEELKFICSDLRLLEAAEREGLATWDPTTA